MAGAPANHLGAADVQLGRSRAGARAVAPLAADAAARGQLQQHSTTLLPASSQVQVVQQARLQGHVQANWREGCSPSGRCTALAGMSPSS